MVSNTCLETVTHLQSNNFYVVRATRANYIYNARYVTLRYAAPANLSFKRVLTLEKFASDGLNSPIIFTKYQFCYVRLAITLAY